MPDSSLADVLNRSCQCINVDTTTLRDSLESRFGSDGAYSRLLETHPHLLADAPVFVGRDQIAEMQRVIDAIEQVVRLPSYQDTVLGWAPESAQADDDSNGVFFGYDFHLTAEGPRLIEINTNAGGALLLTHLANAQQACCDEVGQFVIAPDVLGDLEAVFVDMFRQEFEAHPSGRNLRRIAIVDEDPRSQYLLPEFELFRDLFASAGIDAVIAGPDDFTLDNGQLMASGKPVDVVYNRLTDFYLLSEACQVLRAALDTRAAVFTPGPRAHALYANKRNLSVLCDADRLSTFGVPDATIETLVNAVPQSDIVSNTNADDLWARRRQLYFKPVWGFGSRGTYKGAKLTRKTWSAILENEYIAQALVAPSERVLSAGGEPLTLKVDVRCYTYRGQVQLLGARLYRGQTTNFRTASGGLAAVFTTPAL